MKINIFEVASRIAKVTSILWVLINANDAVDIISAPPQPLPVMTRFEFLEWTKSGKPVTDGEWVVQSRPSPIMSPVELSAWIEAGRPMQKKNTLKELEEPAYKMIKGLAVIWGFTLAVGWIVRGATKQ